MYFLSLICYPCNHRFSIFHNTVTWILNACSALHCSLFTPWMVVDIFRYNYFFLLYALRSLKQIPSIHVFSSIRPKKRVFFSAALWMGLFLAKNLFVLAKFANCLLEWMPTAGSLYGSKVVLTYIDWGRALSQRACPRHHHQMEPAGCQKTWSSAQRSLRECKPRGPNSGGPLHESWLCLSLLQPHFSFLC